MKIRYVDGQGRMHCDRCDAIWGVSMNSCVRADGGCWCSECYVIEREAQRDETIRQERQRRVDEKCDALTHDAEAVLAMLES